MELEDLFAKIDELRCSAARFYAIDLHVHSPVSYDWENKGTVEYTRDPNLDKIPVGGDISDESLNAYRNVIASSERKLVAITDHNRSLFAEALAAKNDDSGLCVLPGIELSVAFCNAPLIRNLRIHVLAVFPEGTHHEAIARVLPPGTAPEDTRDPKETLIYKSAVELINCIHKEGGLAIAAHIEADNGIRGLYKNTTELLLEPIGGSAEAQKVLRALGDQVKDELVKFDAIQVKPTTASIHYTGPDGNLLVPLIVASDCHKSAELSVALCDKYTYVKMAEPSFKALFDALKFPDLRVRFTKGLPKTAPPRLLGLRIVGHKVSDNTFFDDTALGFSDNLTCLIGPRGSGKSAMIDGLRYLMGYNRTLDEISKVSGQVIDRQKHTLANSRVEAIYQTADEQVYKLVATYDPHENYVTEVYDKDGNHLIIEDIGTAMEFPLNLYGWGELELLAESPKTQRNLLDRFISDLKAHKEAKKDTLLLLDDNRKQCVDLANTMERYFSEPELDFLRLKEYKKQYDKLNTDKIGTVFANLDSVKAKRRVLRSIRRKLKERLDEGNISPALELRSHLEDNDLREWAEAFSEKLKPEEIDAWMLEANQQHKSKIKTAMDLVNNEDAELASQEDVAEKEIQAVIGEDLAINGDLRNHAKRRYDNAKMNREDYGKLHDEFNKLIEKRNIHLGTLDACDNLIFVTRNKEINHIKKEISIIEDDNFQIGLELNKKADRSEFLTMLYDSALNFYGSWRAKKRPEIISDNMLPRALAQAIMYNDTATLGDLSVSIDGDDYTMRSVDAENLVNANTPFSEVEGFGKIRVDPTKLDTILQVQQIPIDDDFYITLGGKPIQHCSPGQRCSAMLPVVTLTSQAPLVIDQPEDNLDNRLVSRALFKILARLKETRQIILATHNPNILVSGDAEQVLLLSANGDLEKYGCIDDPAIIESVLSLMEGGEEAFQRRLTKYNPLFRFTVS